MGAKDKKWGAPEERDLALAIIFSQGGSDRPKHDWAKVHNLMTEWGHTFTRDAINQRWSKTILKDFRQRHGDQLSSAASTPVKKRKQEADGDDSTDQSEKRKAPRRSNASTQKSGPKAQGTPKNEVKDSIRVRQDDIFD